MAWLFMEHPATCKKNYGKVRKLLRQLKLDSGLGLGLGLLCGAIEKTVTLSLRNCNLDSQLCHSHLWPRVQEIKIGCSLLADRDGF